MSQQYNQADRLKFLQIDTETRQALQSFWPVIEKKLPGILDGFYDHITSCARKSEAQPTLHG